MQIDPDSVPSTVSDAVDMIVGSLSDEERDLIANTSEPASIHHTVGRFIRNSWSLWENDSPLKRDAVERYGIAHADDISGLIFHWVWSRIWEMEFDPVAHCQRYHDHWRRQGTNSLEAGGWS
jgi:hypothetical protein